MIVEDSYRRWWTEEEREEEEDAIRYEQWKRIL